jgi:hypothetical protein
MAVCPDDLDTVVAAPYPGYGVRKNDTVSSWKLLT